LLENMTIIWNLFIIYIASPQGRF